MADPWLTIIGIGEDGPAGLSPASRAALDAAETVFGAPRHLELAGVGAKGRPWPVPFSTAPVLAERGRKVAVLASGDPFWFGAGGSLIPDLRPGEWVSHPGPSAFQLAANAQGWKIEDVTCLGLHALDFQDRRSAFTRGAQIIATLRDGGSAAEFARWLDDMGWGDSDLWLLERLGGPQQRVRKVPVHPFGVTDVQAPVMAAVHLKGAEGLPRSPGLPDDGFMTDGTMTKAHVRALTLAALAPRPGQMLWDLGAGSGTVSVEWCLAGGRAVAVEHSEKRLGYIRANAYAYGVADRLTPVPGKSLAVLGSLPPPDAVFVGGGAGEALFQALWDKLATGTRVVVNAVTLETESLLAGWHLKKGGKLWKFQISGAEDIGSMRGWISDRPVTQWVVIR